MTDQDSRKLECQNVNVVEVDRAQTKRSLARVSMQVQQVHLDLTSEMSLQISKSVGFHTQERQVAVIRQARVTKAGILNEVTVIKTIGIVEKIYDLPNKVQLWSELKSNLFKPN